MSKSEQKENEIPLFGSRILLSDFERDESEIKTVISYSKAAKELLRIGSGTLPLQITKSAISFANSIIIANISANERNAASLINAFIGLTYNVFNGPISYIQTLVGQLHGSSEQPKLGSAVQAGLTYALLVAIPQVIILAASNPILTNTGQNPEVTSIVTRFFKLYIASVPLMSMQIAYEQIFLGTQKIYYPFIIQLLGLTTFLTSAYPLVYGAWGASAHGVSGSAIAYLLRAGVDLLLSSSILFLFHKKAPQFQAYHLLKFNRQEYKKRLKELLSKGLPWFFVIISDVGILYTLNIMAGDLATDNLSAQLVVSQYQDLSLIFSAAIGAAAQNCISNAIERNKQNINRYGNTSLYLTTVIPLSFLFLVSVQPNLFIRPFVDVDDPANRDIVQLLVDKKLLVISAFSNLFLGLRYVSTLSLFGTGKPDKSIFFNMSIAWVGFVGGATVAYTTSFDGLMSLNLGLMAGYLMSSIGQILNLKRK
jgi:multidrug resistance protein, MATE family